MQRCGGDRDQPFFPWFAGLFTLQATQSQTSSALASTHSTHRPCPFPPLSSVLSSTFQFLPVAPPPFLSSSPPLTCSTLRPRPRPRPGPRPPWRAPCPAPVPSLRLAGCRPPPHSAPPPVSCYPRAWRRPHAPTPGRPRRRSSPRAAGAAAAIVSAQTADSRTLWRWHSRFRVRSVVSGSARLFPDRVPGAAEVEVGVVPRDAEGVRVAAGLGSRLSRAAR